VKQWIAVGFSIVGSAGTPVTTAMKPSLVWQFLQLESFSLSVDPVACRELFHCCSASTSFVSVSLWQLKQLCGSCTVSTRVMVLSHPVRPIARAANAARIETLLNTVIAFSSSIESWMTVLPRQGSRS
jgi:hypothetical protein